MEWEKKSEVIDEELADNSLYEV